MKAAVLLYSLGGPSSLKEVRPFLYEMFCDPEIIKLPKIPRHMLAWYISTKREKKAQGIYQLLGGSSPLLKNTEDQAKALEKNLSKDGEIKTFVIMRYAPPRAQNVIDEIIKFNPDCVVHLPLYPQFSRITSGSSIKEFQEEAKKKKFMIKEKVINSFQTDAFFIQTMKNLILPAVEKAKEFGRPILFLSAHGLPEKIIRDGDPYQRQCEETAEALKNSLQGLNLDMVLSYQSKVGPETWIGPDTDQEIEKAAKEKRPILVVPIAFVSEHSETIVELGMDYKKLALENGAPFYEVVPTVGVDPIFIHGLANRVRKELEK